jgi:hypothetical protein
VTDKREENATTQTAVAHPAVQSWTFSATLVRPDQPGTWTYLVIPLDMPALFAKKGQIKVRGTINGHPFRGAAMPHGDGTHFLVVNKCIRDAIGATQGDRVTVTLQRDDEPRTLSLPDDFAALLRADDVAHAAFSAFSYSHQKEYLDWIESAKTTATRARRMRAALEKIVQRAHIKG